MAETNKLEYPDIISIETRDKQQDPGIIVLIQDNQFDYSFWQSVSEIGFDVYIFETEQEVEELLDTRLIDTIYIRTKDNSLYQSIVTQFKRINQNTSIVYYSDIKEVLSSDINPDINFNIIKDNFKLIHTLLTEENTHSVEHINNVIKYTELLCDRLQISNNEKILAIAAAYVHDFSLLLIDNTVGRKQENDIVRLSSQYLKTINYTPDICNILDLMYTSINTATANTDYFILANILTAADYYSHSKYNQSNLIPEEFKQLLEILRTKIGSDLLPEVGQEFINILYETISISKATTDNCHVLIINESGEDQLMLKSCLSNLGFEAEFVSSVDNLVDCHKKNKADVLVIEAIGSVLQVSDLVNKIEDYGINFEDVTTYLLTNNESLFELTGLLQKGIEDIFSAENDLDPFLIKIIRTRKRISEYSQKHIQMLEKMGTFGSLSDMNLIDLLQTMNGSGKTCLINVTALGNQLMIYIHNGFIVHAENDKLQGEEAIFKGLEWNKGIWNFDPIDISDFPQPNVNKSINSILLEGCQYIDESQKINTDTEINIDETFNFLE